MKVAPLPENEAERIGALLRYNVLDTEFEAAYDELTRLASSLCDTPICLISLVDSQRQWFKSSVGLDARETPRDLAFCAHAIHHPDEVMQVDDAAKDERFSDNPLVKDAPYIRFYAGAPLVTSDGYALGTLCVIDRKPRHLGEDQLSSLQILANQTIKLFELRYSYHRLESYAADVSAANEAKDRFFSIISHDLRSPFNSLLLLSQSLCGSLDKTEQPKAHKFATVMHETAQSAYTLLENLLTWANCETGRIAFEPSDVDLVSVVSSTATLLRGAASEKGVSLSVDVCDALVIQGDENMINSIVQNLMSNAIKFTPRDGEVTVTLSTEEGQAKIEVIDTGLGMSSEQLEALFVVGKHQSQSGTDGETGSGLGLLLCQQFVERHGGRLQALSTLHKGTTMRLWLPLS